MPSHPLFSRNLAVAGEWEVETVLAQAAAVDPPVLLTQACQAPQWDNKQEQQAIRGVRLIYPAALQVPPQKVKRNINLPIKQERQEKVDQDLALPTVELRARWAPQVDLSAEAVELLEQVPQAEHLEVAWAAVALLEDHLNKSSN